MSVTSPLVVDLGKVRKQHIDELRRGVGPIVEDVAEVMKVVRTNADLEREKRVLLPVVVLYERT
jgi:hypothetical protein